MTTNRFLQFVEVKGGLLSAIHPSDTFVRPATVIRLNFNEAKPRFLPVVSNIRLCKAHDIVGDIYIIFIKFNF